MSLKVSHRIARRLIFITAIASAAVVTSPEDARAQTTSQASPQVRYRQAHAAFKAGKWAEARQLLLALWKEEPTYDVAVTLVQVEYQLQHYAAAARYLQFALAKIPPTEDPSTAQDYKEQLEELRPRIATINLEVDVDGVEFFVADEKLGRSPLAGPLYLDPGSYTLEARRGDWRDRRDLKVAGGSSYALTFKLGQAAPTVVSSGLTTDPTPPAGQPQPPPSGSSDDEHGWTARHSAIAAIGGGLSLLALGSGIAFRVDAGNKQDRVDQLKAEAGGRCPVGSDATVCRDLKGTAESRNSSASLSNISFVATGVIVAATATALYLLPRSTGGSQHAVVVPAVAPGFGGLFLKGAF
jgi:hypothetical protein